MSLDQIVEARRFALDDATEVLAFLAKPVGGSRSCTEPTIEPRGLRISWASPAAMRPRAARCSACSARCGGLLQPSSGQAQSLGQVLGEQHDDHQHQQVDEERIDDLTELGDIEAARLVGGRADDARRRTRRRAARRTQPRRSPQRRARADR